MQEEKRRLVQAWIIRARRDLLGAQQLAPNLPDLAIYHCQQGAEKALKAVLVLHDQDPGKTHNIDALIREASAFRPELLARLREAASLSEYNQTFRYPSSTTSDSIPTPGELRKAFRIARDIYNDIVAGMPKEIVGSTQRHQQQTEQQRSQSEDLEL